MALGEIVVSLLAKTGAFDTDIDRSTKATQKRMKEMQRTVEEAGKAFGIALGAGAAAAAFFTKKWIDELDALNDAADATGASIENLSALEDVALRTGTSMDTATGALVKFNAALKGTDDDNKAAKALEAIGLNIEELRRLDPAEALLQTAIALAKFADDGDKARLVQELFGKSVLEMAPLLKDLAEKGQLVATVTTEQAKEAEAFNKELFTMQKNVADLGRAFASDLVTGINNAANAFRQNGSVWDAIKTLFGGTDQYKADKRFAQLTDDLLRAENALSKLKGASLPGFMVAGSLRAAQADVDRIRAELAPLLAARTALPPAMSLDDLRRAELAFRPSVGSLGGGGKPAKPPKPPRPARAPAEKPFTTSDRFSEADALAREAEIMGEAQELRAKEFEKTFKQAREQEEKLNRLLANTPSAILERQQQDLQFLANLVEIGELAPEKFEEAATAMLGLGKATEQTKSMTEELGLTFASAFEDAVLGGRDVGDVFKGLLQDIARVILRLGVIEPMMKKLKDSMGGGEFDFGKTILGALGGLFGGGGVNLGTATGADLALAFADGGDPPVGRASWVGERGPELFVPRTAGTIIPNHALGGGGNITLVNQTSAKVGNVQEQRTSNGDRVLYLQEAVEAVAAQISNPNSKVSQSLHRHTTAGRRR